MEVMDCILDELHSREAYKCDIFAPYYVCSYATHIFNLMNQKKQFYWESKRLPNMRLHLLFVAPPGFMKSYYMSTMGGDKFGIFSNSNCQIGYEQSMTEAGFVGTVQNFDGKVIETEGAAQTFSKGILMIDEFSAITNAFKTNYNNQMDSQMLSALDHGRVIKRLGSGKIEYQTNMTLWAGVQPVRYDLTSGMGRRFCMMLFLPTRADNEALLDTMHKTRNITPDHIEMSKLWSGIDQWIADYENIETVKFGDSVFDIYRKMKIFSFESSYFDRLILGYHLATYGPEKHLTIEATDSRLISILDREKEWRDAIVTGLDYVQIKQMIHLCGIHKDGMLCVQRAVIIKEAIMVGWNAHQVNEIIINMVKDEELKLRGNLIIMDVSE